MYNHAPLIPFELFTAEPSVGKWLNRGHPIPERDWNTNERIDFSGGHDATKSVRPDSQGGRKATFHGAVSGSKATSGSMVLTFEGGKECKLDYAYSGEACPQLEPEEHGDASCESASSSSDCPEFVISTVDNINGKSITFVVQNAPPAAALELLTDALAEKQQTAPSRTAMLMGISGMLSLVAFTALASWRRSAVASVQAQPAATELAERC